MKTGCYTALVSPFRNGGIDNEGLEKLAEFQIKNGIAGILAVGTTGESPTLSWEEHNQVVEVVAQKAKGRCICIAGTGSNNTRECLAATEHAVGVGADAVLLVDPYYNGPSSMEIRREYVAPVAAAFPSVEIIPYVIPGRTGCQLLPEDLALLNQEFANVNTVKEATSNIENMKRTRACCGTDFTIMSGDDGMTFKMMTDPAIEASGVISVASNVAPKAVTDMVRLLATGETAAAEKILADIEPLFSLVTVTTTEHTPFGDVGCRARNPMGIKTLMAVLGMPAGGCRQPLGKMSKNGLDNVLAVGRNVHANNPDILSPVADFFGVDIEKRLEDPASWEGLAYDAY